MMREDIARQVDLLRSMDDPQESLPTARAPYFSNFAQESNPPLSPRQMPQSDSRRPSLANINNPQPPPFKAPVAPHLALSPRRYGSISGGSYTPSARTPAHQQASQLPPPPPPQIQHPLSTSVSAESPHANLSRRHTSADIRLHGWNGPPQPSPYASGHNSTQWPSSPHRTPLGGDQQIRDALAQYQLPRDPRQQLSRQPTPPPDVNPASSNVNSDSGWTLPGARYSFKNLDASYPPTRRSSMASNVHSLLNPAETAERDEEDNDDRKRKRLQ